MVRTLRRRGSLIRRDDPAVAPDRSTAHRDPRAAGAYGADGNVAEAFTPRFNTLNLLKVPTPHSVTQVALSAAADRISVTGWLRGA